MQNEASYICDNCGEEIVIPIDFSEGDEQEYTEDCPVCCCPNVIFVTMAANGEIQISSRAE